MDLFRNYLNKSTCAAAPEGVYVFPAASAMDDDNLNVADRAGEINKLFVRYNSARAMKGSGGPPWTPDRPRPFIIRRKVRVDPPGMRIFLLHSTPHRERQNDKDSGRVASFLISACVLIVYVTSMNTVYSISS